MKTKTISLKVSEELKAQFQALDIEAKAFLKHAMKAVYDHQMKDPLVRLLGEMLG